MSAVASQITSLTIVCSTVYPDADQRKHQSSASLAFVWGIHRGPVNSPHKWPVTRKMSPFDDVIMSVCRKFSYGQTNKLTTRGWTQNLLLSAEVTNAGEMTYDTDTSVLLRNTCIKKWMEIETRIYMYMYVCMYVCLHATKRPVKHINSLEQYNIIKINDSNISKQSPFIVIN